MQNCSVNYYYHIIMHYYYIIYYVAASHSYCLPIHHYY